MGCITMVVAFSFHSFFSLNYDCVVPLLDPILQFLLWSLNISPQCKGGSSWTSHPPSRDFSQGPDEQLSLFAPILLVYAVSKFTVAQRIAGSYSFFSVFSWMGAPLQCVINCIETCLKSLLIGMCIIVLTKLLISSAA